MDTVLFFAAAIVIGLIIHKAMLWLDHRNPHTQRITIVSLAFCFAMAYIAEQYFGIADITGAYIAGIVLCSLEDASYVERRVDISNYTLFCARLLRQHRPEDRHQRPDAQPSCCSASASWSWPSSPRSSAAVWPRKLCRFSWARLPQGGRRHDDPRRGGPDRGPEGPRRSAWWTPSTSLPSSCSSWSPRS